MAIDPDDLLVCDCAQCGRELLARSMIPHFGPDDRPPMPFVAGRLNGRPYCPGCFEPRVIPPGRPTPLDDDGGPWQQNAVRDLEEGL